MTKTALLVQSPLMNYNAYETRYKIKRCLDIHGRKDDDHAVSKG